MRSRRTLILISIGLVVAVGFALLLMRDAVVEVEIAEARRGVFEDVIVEEGRTRARWYVDITATVAGEWRPEELEVGDEFRAGELLGTLIMAPPDPATARQLSARVASADAALIAAQAAESVVVLAGIEAERALGRAERLGGAGGISQQQVELARTEAATRISELEGARALVAAARHERDALRALLPGGGALPARIVAPASGIVLRLDEKHRRVVPPGAPLLQFGSSGTPEVVARVLSSDASRVRVGSALIAISGRDTLKGHVTRVEPTAHTVRSALGVDEQRVPVIGALDDSESQLGHDFQIDVSIVTERYEGVLVIPSGALMREGGRWFVFAVGANDRVHRQEVALVARGTEQGVVEGIDEDTRVVVYPPESLTDGARVRALVVPRR